MPRTNETEQRARQLYEAWYASPEPVPGARFRFHAADGSSGPWEGLTRPLHAYWMDQARRAEERDRERATEAAESAE